MRAQPGAVAAPTAGLHFDAAAARARLRARGVALAYAHAARRRRHVPAGRRATTWRSTACTASAIDIPADDRRRDRRGARARDARVVAVGTTALRALESAADADGDVRAGAAETALFITPGYRFRVVDRLLTNFHLPRSTLLMLVSAFAGYDAIRAAYAHAIARALPLLQLRRRDAARARRVDALPVRTGCGSVRSCGYNRAACEFSRAVAR